MTSQKDSRVLHLPSHRQLSLGWTPKGHRAGVCQTHTSPPSPSQAGLRGPSHFPAALDPGLLHCISEPSHHGWIKTEPQDSGLAAAPRPPALLEARPGLWEQGEEAGPGEPWALRPPWETEPLRTLRVLELICPAVGTEQGLGAGREPVPFSTSVWSQSPL